MTDNIKWGGATYDGVAFSDVGLIVTGVDIPLLPDVSIVEDEFDGYDGVVDVAERYGPRTIDLSVVLIAESEAEYQSKLQQIAALFNARKGARPLVLSRAAGKRWLCRYNGRIPIERQATVGEFKIPLKAYIPFAESITSSTEPLRLGQGYSLGQGLRLSNGTAKFTITNSPTTITVSNLGTYRTYPKLTVKTVSAVGSGLTIENRTTGETLTVAAPIPADSTLIIDCAPLVQSSWLNGTQTDGIVDGDFIRIDPGDNELIVTAVSSVNFTLDVEYRHLYLY